MLGAAGAEMGNVHLKWAFSEAAVLFLRHTHTTRMQRLGSTDLTRYLAI